MLREVLPLFLMPVPIVLALLAFAAWRRSWRIAVCATLLLWILSTPLTSGWLVRLAESGFVRPKVADIPVADGIVVLSGGLIVPPGDSGTYEFLDFDRFLGGFDLYRAGKARHLIFTGGWSPVRQYPVTVGDVLRERALSFGVPDSDIILVGRATNTSEEARAVAAHFAAHPLVDPTTTQPRAPRLILVTSAFHMARAASLFRAAGLEITPFAVDFRASGPITILTFIPRGSSLEQTEIALHEIYGRTYDWLRGLLITDRTAIP